MAKTIQLPLILRDKKAGKTYNFFIQVLTIVAVLFVSKIIESFIPFPMPASVIGLVLLFILLSVGVVKLRQVERCGDRSNK